LEIERIAVETRWTSAHPGGELKRLDTAEVDRLAGELASPSLFAAERLLVVRDASAVLEGKERGRGKEAAEALLACLKSSWDRDTSLLLCVASSSEPRGALADYVRAHGTLTWLPLPAPPKPWDDVRLSGEQRRTLERLLERTVPPILAHPEVVEVLLDHFGFKPRQLVQAAERVLLAGQPDAQELRAELGPPERSIEELEKALLERNGERLAHFLAVLSAGGELVNWRGERISPGGVAAVLGATLHRLLRNALAMREVARRAGLASELDLRRCAAPRWYATTFQKRLHPLLERQIEAAAGCELADASVWQRHRAFKMAAAYSDGELRRALAALSRAIPEREREGSTALAIFAQVLLGMVIPRPAVADRAGGGESPTVGPPPVGPRPGKALGPGRPPAAGGPSRGWPRR
jgi:hypothetical protein